MFSKLANLPRLSKQIIMIFTDSILLILILWASFSIRLDLWYLPKDDTIRLILAAPIIGIPIFAKLGLYKSVVRHIDLKSMWYLFLAVSFYSLIWGFFCFFMKNNYVEGGGFFIEIFPRSVVIINWSRFSPAKQQEVTFGTGNLISAICLPVFPSKPRTQEPIQNATQILSSLSEHIPSG